MYTPTAEWHPKNQTLLSNMYTRTKWTEMKTAWHHNFIILGLWVCLGLDAWSVCTKVIWYRWNTPRFPATIDKGKPFWGIETKIDNVIFSFFHTPKPCRCFSRGLAIGDATKPVMKLAAPPPKQRRHSAGPRSEAPPWAKEQFQHGLC